MPKEDGEKGTVKVMKGEVKMKKTIGRGNKKRRHVLCIMCHDRI